MKKSWSTNQVYSNNLSSGAPGCDDFHWRCPEWAKYGHCTSETGLGPDWMNVNCPNSCGTCHIHYSNWGKRAGKLS